LGAPSLRHSFFRASFLSFPVFSGRGAGPGAQKKAHGRRQEAHRDGH
jgi:hypothetical protein